MIWFLNRQKQISLVKNKLIWYSDAYTFDKNGQFNIVCNLAMNTSLVTELVKNPPAMQETRVWSVVQENPGERNGNPLQHSCLENPMDRGACQATVHGVARFQHDLAIKSPPPLTKKKGKKLLIPIRHKNWNMHMNEFNSEGIGSTCVKSCWKT